MAESPGLPEQRIVALSLSDDNEPEEKDQQPNSHVEDELKQVCRVRLPEAGCYEGFVAFKQATEPENDDQLSTTTRNLTAEAPSDGFLNTSSDSPVGEEVTITTPGDETNNSETDADTVANTTQNNSVQDNEDADPEGKVEESTDETSNALSSECHLTHLPTPGDTPQDGCQTLESPVDKFFAKYPSFTHRIDEPFNNEFNRMASHFGWSVKQRTAAYEGFRIALVEEFNQIYGKDENDMTLWKKLFDVIGLTAPSTLEEACSVLSQVHVNLYDVVETRQTNIAVQRFSDMWALKKYSFETGRLFPREDEFAGRLLQTLTRVIGRKYAGPKDKRARGRNQRRRR